MAPKVPMDPDALPAARRRWRVRPARLGAALSVAGLLACSLAAAQPAPETHFDLERITQCMRDNVPERLLADVEFSVAADDQHAPRTVNATLRAETEQSLHRLTWRARSPGGLAGAAVLTRDDISGLTSYLYEPTAGKVRRIGLAGQEQPLFGTDLSLGDAARAITGFGDTSLKILGETRLQERVVWKIVAGAPPGTSSIYDHIDLQVDEQACLTLRADMWWGRLLRKRWEVDTQTITRTGHYWYATSGTLRNVAEKSQTHLQLSAIQIDVTHPRDEFDAHHFFEH